MSDERIYTADEIRAAMEKCGCTERLQCRQMHDGFWCTQPLGHKGAHIACGLNPDQHGLAKWANEAAAKGKRE